jgi:Eukaryotic aspartyl protease
LTFGLATNLSAEFANFPMDGICGMGRLGNADLQPGAVGANTLMDVLASEGIITSKQFGLRVSRGSDNLNDGEVNFGAPDPAAFQETLNVIPAANNSAGFWEIPLQSAMVNGTMASLQSNITLLLDSGTSYILIPVDDAVTLHRLIPDSNRTSDETWTVPCSSSFPISFVLGDKQYDISPKDWIGGALGDGQCNSLIVGRLTFGPNRWLVGDVFLKNVYTVFDFDNGAIGLGYPVGTSIPPSATPTMASSTSTVITQIATAAPTTTAAPSPSAQPAIASDASHSDRAQNPWLLCGLSMVTGFITVVWTL